MCPMCPSDFSRLWLNTFRDHSISQTLRYLPGPVPCVPPNCQTACDDRLKAGPLRESRPAPGFRKGWGGARAGKFPGHIFPEKNFNRILTKNFPGPCSKKISRDLFQNEVHILDSVHELWVGNNSETHVGVRREGTSLQASKWGFFSL
jgi:hypothetical protein